MVSGWNWWRNLPKLSRAFSDLSEAISGVYLFFIVVNLSFYKTTGILLGVSIVVSCSIMYFEIYVVSSLSFKHVWLGNKDTFCLYNFIKIFSSFLISVLVSGWNWWMNLPIFFYLTFLIIGSYIVFISILALLNRSL